MRTKQGVLLVSMSIWVIDITFNRICAFLSIEVSEYMRRQRPPVPADAQRPRRKVGTWSTCKFKVLSQDERGGREGERECVCECKREMAMTMRKTRKLKIRKTAATWQARKSSHSRKHTEDDEKVGPQLPRLLTKPDAGFLYAGQRDGTTQVLYTQK